MMTYIKKGYGYSVGQDFNRAVVDTPIDLALDEHALPHHVIGYIAGDSKHPLGFMRAKRVRVHVRRDCLTDSTNHE